MHIKNFCESIRQLAQKIFPPMAKQVLFITILITLCVPTVGTGAFKEKNLNFDDISSSKTEYYYDPVMLLAFLFFLQNNSFQNN